MSNKTKAALLPVKVSGDALRVLSSKMREWSGWRDSTVRFGVPQVSPFAQCDHSTHTFTANVDILLRNPNRVLYTVTPFRLRQEAVLTGCLLHEAGHARFTKWKPTSPEDAMINPLLHSDGTVPTPQVVAFALLMEEPRVEGLIFTAEDNIGATGLSWTMQAAAAHLVPFTSLSAHADQAMMDLITSWTLRAGRQIAMNGQVVSRTPRWVGDFTSLLHRTMIQHLTETTNTQDPVGTALMIRLLIEEMILWDGTENADANGEFLPAHTAPFMIDHAREVLALLFPETEAPMPAASNCGDAAQPSESEAGDGGEGDEEGAEGEGNTEPEDEGSGDDPGAGDSGDDDAEPTEDDAEETGEGDESDDQPEGEPEEGDDESGPENGSEEGEVDTESQVATDLAEMEALSKQAVDALAQHEADKEPPTPTTSSMSGGSGEFSDRSGSWRTPTPVERGIQKSAERFLRSMIDPSESSQVRITESPSATVDGGALAAWKSSGGVRDPKFFLRTRRTVQPTPPIKIAVLVDVSSSMDEMQKPSAFLSWALASAAVDLRNFAGRGQQVESTLIHWGNEARVIQRNGEPMPGIRNAPCNEGTSAMHKAFALVEEQMPGFFEVTEQPVNRLMVQFTDWQLFGIRDMIAPMQSLMEAGVNMLSIVPRDYSARYSSLNDVMAQCPKMNGTSALLKYNGDPESVWSEAAHVLATGQAGRPAPFAGF